MTQSKPDMDNYLDRITEIEQVIFSTAVVVKNPTQVPRNPPYILHLAGNATPAPLTQKVRTMTYSIRMLMVRGTPGSSGNYQIESTIQSDMVDLSWNFMMIDDYRNLITTTYTTVQTGFKLDSVSIINQSRFQGATMTGEVIGSIGTLQFSHYMFNTPSGQI